MAAAREALADFKKTVGSSNHLDRAVCYGYAVNDKNSMGYRLEGQNMPQPPTSSAGDAATGLTNMQLETQRTIAGVKADGGLYAGPGGSPPKPKPGYYVVAFLTCDPENPGSGGDDGGMGHHFMRQDSNGHWSQKMGPGRVTDRDNKGKIITDPEKSDNGALKVTAYFYIPKGGLKVGQQEPVAQPNAAPAKTADPVHHNVIAHQIKPPLRSPGAAP